MTTPQRDEVIAGALETARELLGMDAAYVAEFDDGRQVFQAVAGDADSFGIEVGSGHALDQSFCVRMVHGQIPHAVPDAAAHAALDELPLRHDAGIGAYVGVPLRSSDGALRGSFCCISHQPSPELAERDIAFMHVLARLVMDHIERAELIEDRVKELDERVRERTRHLRSALIDVELANTEALIRLSHAVEYRDETTGTHVARVGQNSARLAELAGLGSSFSTQLGVAAPLHDIGKVAIPDAILMKPGRLTPEEHSVMEQHVGIGHELLAGSRSPVLELAAAVALTHHERFDGNGYGRGLSGEDIPVEGRIVAIADVFDALTSTRPYRAASAPRAAGEIMRGESGRHFDPELLAVFLAEVERL